MNAETDGPGSLRDMELEVEAEGREWMRRRLEQNLQAQANRHGGVFPQSGRKAQRGGLGRARQVLAVAAGAPWIWNVVGDRWSGAHQLLDFYHASKHLWTLGQALHPEERGGPPGLGGDATASHAAMPAPAPRSVLAEGGITPLGCLGRSPRQWPRGRTLAHVLMVRVSNCSPSVKNILKGLPIAARTMQMDPMAAAGFEACPKELFQISVFVAAADAGALRHWEIEIVGAATSSRSTH